MSIPRRHFALLTAAGLATIALPALAAEERARPEEAKAMLAKAMAHIKAVGRE